MLSYLIHSKCGFFVNTNDTFLVESVKKRFNHKFKELKVRNLDDLFNYIASNIPLPIDKSKDICFYSISDKNNEIHFGMIHNRDYLESLSSKLFDCGEIYSLKGLSILVDKSVNPHFIRANVLGEFLSTISNINHVEKYGLNVEDSLYLNFKPKSILVESIKKIEPVLHTEENMDFHDKSELCGELPYTDDERYIEMFNHFNRAFMILNELYDSKDDLNKTISICDLATLNSLHKLELDFHKLNACQVFYEGKKLNSIRNKRRIAKDKKFIVENLYDSYCHFFEDFTNLLSKLDSRSYNERDTYGMFDDNKLRALETDLELKELVENP